MDSAIKSYFESLRSQDKDVRYEAYLKYSCCYRRKM